MRETLHKIGRHHHLQAVVSAPKKTPLDASKPCVVLLNAGVVHKAGPFSLNVFLARNLAQAGYLCLRFDFSGMGDSGKGVEQGSNQDVLLKDMSDLMDFAQGNYAAQKFIFIGLCTGADNAHKIAVVDERVKGIVLLDGYGYTNLKFYIRRYLPKMMSPWKKTINFLKKITKGKTKKVNVSEDAALGIDDYVWSLPPKGHYIRDMNLLFGRGVKCLYVYTGGVNVYYNYKDQYKDVFRKNSFCKSVEVIYKPHCNHTYMIRKDKFDLLDDILQWLYP